MESIPKHYVVDEENNKIAVQIPIEAYKKLERIIEAYESVQHKREIERNKLLRIQEDKGFIIDFENTE